MSSYVTRSKMADGIKVSVAVVRVAIGKKHVFVSPSLITHGWISNSST